MHICEDQAQPHPRFFLVSTGACAFPFVGTSGFGTSRFLGLEPAALLKDPSLRSAFPEAPPDPLKELLFQGFTLFRADPKFVCNHSNDIHLHRH
jgi:hypothetical protein